MATIVFIRKGDGTLIPFFKATNEEIKNGDRIVTDKRGENVRILDKQYFKSLDEQLAIKPNSIIDNAVRGVINNATRI